MTNPECAFCDHDALQDRVVYFGKSILTIVSRPWYRQNHLLVIPKQHRTTVGELTQEEDTEITDEIKTLLPIIDNGDGTMHFQKTRPSHAGNGITMSHIHHHIYPILPADKNILVPAPQVTSDFHMPTTQETEAAVLYVQRERAKLFER